MIIDHIGIVVKDIEKGLQYWEKVFGYKQHTSIVLNTRQKVRVVFLKKENSVDVKLVEPSDQTSPVFRVANRGGGLHHICFKCRDLDSQINVLKENDIRLLVPPEPGEAFDNEKIAFMLTSSGLNIELIDTEKRAHLLHYSNAGMLKGEE